MVDIEQIKKLRAQTGVGLTDAKKALEEADGDFDKAVEAMRVKGLSRADKKADRETSVGIIHSYVHGTKIGVLVELLCETDFVAKTEEFKTVANDIALHVAASNPEYLSADQIPSEVKEKEENLVKAELKESGKPENMFDKIVPGKMNKFYERVCLMNQPFVKDPDQTIEQYIKAAIAKLGENITLKRFTRLELGG